MRWEAKQSVLTSGTYTLSPKSALALPNCSRRYKTPVLQQQPGQNETGCFEVKVSGWRLFMADKVYYRKCYLVPTSVIAKTSQTYLGEKHSRPELVC